MENPRKSLPRKFASLTWKTVKFIFIVFLIYVGSLFFREERLPRALSEALLNAAAPKNLIIHCASIGYGVSHGLTFYRLRVYDRTRIELLKPMAEVEELTIHPLLRHVYARGLMYARLPDSYYAPGNLEKNRRVEARFPQLPPFSFTLEQPAILSVTPRRVIGEVMVRPGRIDFKNLHLDWPDEDRAMSVDGLCYVDIDNQDLYGEIRGTALQKHIRPLLEALDVPVAFPYFDGFTHVTEPVPSFCSWRVNLVNNDFDLKLDLKPTMGEYNGVPMRSADGQVLLHNFIRGTNLNYRQTIGPIVGVGPAGEKLKGTIIVGGIDGQNTVEIDAESGLSVASLLKIGGFTGKYLDEKITGDSRCKINFRFPRAMTNNYEVLNGDGHVEIKNGLLMQLPIFAGLTEVLSDKVPGLSWVTDQTQASCDYTITNGVLKTDNIFIEGGFFSIKMFGQFDAVREKLDFTARIQFMKNDSMLGKILHPLTWPFTKLLTEARLTGSPAKPKWHYISILDRVMEAVK